jgi:hypothetical protein
LIETAGGGDGGPIGGAIGGLLAIMVPSSTAVNGGRVGGGPVTVSLANCLLAFLSTAEWYQNVPVCVNVYVNEPEVVAWPELNSDPAVLLLGTPLTMPSPLLAFVQIHVTLVPTAIVRDAAAMSFLSLLHMIAMLLKVGDLVGDLVGDSEHESDELDQISAEEIRTM